MKEARTSNEIAKELRKIADSSVDEKGIALAVIISPTKIRRAADEIDRLRGVLESLNRVALPLFARRKVDAALYGEPS